MLSTLGHVRRDFVRNQETPVSRRLATPFRFDKPTTGQNDTSRARVRLFWRRAVVVFIAGPHSPFGPFYDAVTVGRPEHGRAT